MNSKLKFGLLLPHFGADMSVGDCREGARRAEAYGFDSVWARDHLVFTPHAGEGGDSKHLECLLLLASLAPLTTKLQFGTAMAICHRHPIHLAQCCAGLSEISNGRLILGLGFGGFPHEFAAAGRPARSQTAPSSHESMSKSAGRCGAVKRCRIAATSSNLMMWR